ncbi:MAG TPA: Lrp/AsnC family transcriptional regulator [Desulfohalobiaceae bacterium]|nr:Lrp/AsnC family transcriptional regulator [Desulfohalobiaceae bacterium]
MTFPIDSRERMILDIIQTDFPIIDRPYSLIGYKIGLTEAETLALVRGLQQKGVIRRIGANFQSRKLGWKSTLCAASVSEHMLDSFVNIVNQYAGVTHNYLRRHTYNVWFTYIGPSWDSIEKDIEDIRTKTGIQILNLPAKKMFKIQVDFRMQDDLMEDVR